MLSIDAMSRGGAVMVKVWVSISGGGVRVVVYAASVYVTVVV